MKPHNYKKDNCQERILDISKKKIIVLSRNYSTGLGVIRSLGSAGCDVELIASTKKKGSSVIASCSRFVASAMEIQSLKIQGDDGENIIEVLTEKGIKHQGKAVLFPTDDFTAYVIASNYERLEPYYIMPSTAKTSGFCITDIMDKSFQHRLAEKCGLPVPWECVIPLQGEIVIPDEMHYPCFVKPLQSVSGSKNEMKCCYSRNELSSCLEEMKKFYGDRSVLIQDFLEIRDEYDLSGVCADQDVLIPGIIKKDRIAQFEKGVTMTGKMYSTEILSEIMTEVREFLKELHYTGMFDMEFIQTGDRIYFNEINLRSGGPSYFYYLNGINLPEIAVQAFFGIKPDCNATCKTGTTFVYEKVAWEDYIHGFFTKRDMEKAIGEADFTLITNAEDKKPGKVFNRRIRLSLLKNKVYKLLGR